MLVIRRLFGTGTNCIAPSGLPLLLSLFPGLAPWAFLSRPCGASFAPETSLVPLPRIEENDPFLHVGNDQHVMLRPGVCSEHLVNTRGAVGRYDDH